MAKVEIERSGNVSILRINRPEVHNCVDGETAVMLARAILDFESDENASVLVVTGAGEKAFCSGADLKAADQLMQHEFSTHASPMGFGRLDPGKPTIAAVNGYCFAGGMELAAWCDFRIASENAEFGALNRRWGVPFIDGGTHRFPRIMGQGGALYLVETGLRIDSKRALQLGFVQEVVPVGRALERALEIAKRIAEYPQTSLRLDRRSVIEGGGLDPSSGLELEAKLGFESVGSDELQKGLARYGSGDRPPAPR